MLVPEINEMPPKKIAGLTGEMNNGFQLSSQGSIAFPYQPFFISIFFFSFLYFIVFIILIVYYYYYFIFIILNFYYLWNFILRSVDLKDGSVGIICEGERAFGSPKNKAKNRRCMSLLSSPSNRLSKLLSQCQSILLWVNLHF